MNFNTKECENLANNLCKLFISKNDKDYLECEQIYLNHFLKSKEHGNVWMDCFTKNVRKILTDKKINSNIISAMINTLEFKIFLNETILFNIKDIIYNNKKLNFEKISSNSNLSFLSENFKQDRFFKYANNFILNKMYLVVNEYNKIFNKPELFSFDILFDKLNSNSINGKLFFITDTFIFFKIPVSKYSDFYFHFNNKLHVIYEGQNLELDKEKVFLNFIHSNIIYDNDISVCESNYKLFENTDKHSLVNNISNEENIDYYLIKETIKSNVNFNYNFSYLSNNENLTNYDVFCLILLNISNYKILDKNIDSNLTNLFINEIAFQHNINDIIDQNYIEKNIVSVFLTLKNYEKFINNSSYSINYKNHFEKTTNLIKPLLILFLNKLYKTIDLKHSNEITIKNSLYSIGIFDKKNRDICYKILSDFNLKNNKDFYNYFKEDFEWISSLLNSIQFENIFTIISDLISNNINEDTIIKKITLKYPNYNQKEIKKIILKVKNKTKN